MFSHIVPSPKKHARDELTSYMSTPIEKAEGGPIKWWADRDKVCPKLSWVARDFLSAPGEFFVFHFGLAAEGLTSLLSNNDRRRASV
jgi:hypothetical protein